MSASGVIADVSARLITGSPQEQTKTQRLKIASQQPFALGREGAQEQT